MLLTLIKGAVTVAPAVEAIMRQRRAREAADELRDLVAERAALQRAWEAFQVQSHQRNILFAAFVASIAILGLTYALGLIGDLPVLAAAIAAAGAVLVVFFNRFDALQRGRMHVIEANLREINERLVAEGDPTQAFLTQASLGGLYYETLAVIFHAVVFWGFFTAFVFALVDAA